MSFSSRKLAHDAYAWLRGDEYDGIMNYSLTKACLDYLVYDVFDAQAMADRLSHILMRNTDQVNRMMLNLLDSHDTERFLTLAKKSGKDERSLLCALAILFFSGRNALHLLRHGDRDGRRV